MAASRNQVGDAPSSLLQRERLDAEAVGKPESIRALAAITPNGRIEAGTFGAIAGPVAVGGGTAASNAGDTQSEDFMMTSRCPRVHDCKSLEIDTILGRRRTKGGEPP